jgi:hypothetical protein
MQRSISVYKLDQQTAIYCLTDFEASSIQYLLLTRQEQQEVEKEEKMPDNDTEIDARVNLTEPYANVKVLLCQLNNIATSFMMMWNKNRNIIPKQPCNKFRMTRDDAPIM